MVTPFGSPFGSPFSSPFRLPFFPSGGVNPNFQILIKTDNAGTTDSTSIGLPVDGTFDIDWGDGNTETITGAVHTTATTHDYGVGNAGNYVVKIGSGLTRIVFSGAGDCRKLLEIQNWGVVQWLLFTSAFQGCINVTITANDAPDLSALQEGSSNNLSLIFRDADYLTGETFLEWDFSTVNSINRAFIGCDLFNVDFGGWSLAKLRFFNYAFFNSGMTTENYSRGIIGFANQVYAGSGPYNVSMIEQNGMTYNNTVYGTGHFTDAVSARAYLVAATDGDPAGAGWTIIGDAAV